MKWMKTLLIALALIAGSSGIAAAQQHGWQDRDHDGDRDRDHDRYEQRRQTKGQRKAERERERERERKRRQVFRNRGVYRGGQYPVYGGRYPVYGGQYPVYGPNQNPYYATGIQEAQRNGYQYGLHDGQIDRQEGRSYRATTNESYEHADIGYVSAYGPKNDYRSAFRQAYLQAYQRTYGSGGGYVPNGRVPWGR